MRGRLVSQGSSLGDNNRFVGLEEERALVYVYGVVPPCGTPRSSSFAFVCLGLLRCAERRRRILQMSARPRATLFKEGLKT